MNGADVIVENVFRSTEFSQYAGTMAANTGAKAVSFPWLKVLLIAGIFVVAIFVIRQIISERQHMQKSALPPALELEGEQVVSVT